MDTVMQPVIILLVSLMKETVINVLMIALGVS
jgi:hypothetical protein